MRPLAIAAAALVLLALVAYALGLGIYAYASTRPAIATQPRSAREARDAVERMGLAREYPFSHRFALTPHGRMHYLDEGAGPPVLLLHGNGSWSLQWSELVRARSAKARVVAPDLIGFGLSEKPAVPPHDALDAHAADLAALVDLLDLRDVELVAAPSAAAIAERLAAREKPRIRSLALDGAPARALSTRLAQAPVLGEVLVQGLGALSPGFARSPLGLAQGSWDERSASLAWARALAAD
jgi:pimeloyl-ACP methyl ester carboxylesterase